MTEFERQLIEHNIELQERYDLLDRNYTTLLKHRISDILGDLYEYRQYYLDHKSQEKKQKHKIVSIIVRD